jgi:SAM-dependent methyltransferase
MLKEVLKQYFQRNNYSCPICLSKEFEKYSAMKGYLLSRCSKCGMVWDPAPPEKLEDVYNENYFVNSNPKGGYANYFEGMSINKRTFYERVKRINDHVSQKRRMLDVGSALGDSLIEAKRLGWENLYGVELSEYAATESKKRGLNIKEGDLRSAKYQTDFFDVVTLQDVVEHFKNPMQEMVEIWRILKPGGIVFVVTPDIGGFWLKLLGRYWYHYKPGEHIMYFNENTLRIMLHKAGFSHIKTRKTYHVMSVEYIFNRLKYYSPWLFELLLKMTKENFIGKLSFRVYSGEIEAWGQK